MLAGSKSVFDQFRDTCTLLELGGAISLKSRLGYLRGLIVFRRQFDGVVPLVEADTRGDGLRDVVALNEGVHRLLAHAHRAVMINIFCLGRWQND